MNRVWRQVLGVVLVFASACQCRSSSTQGAQAEFRVTPGSLELGDVYVGQSASGTVDVANVGSASGTVAVSVDAPFAVDVASLQVARGDHLAVTVWFAPAAPGAVSGVLHVGDAGVPVTAQALLVPQCAMPGACQETHFDFSTRQCVTSRRSDNSTCESACVASGVCLAGECVGAFRDCEDHDECTVESCSVADGCRHTPKVCPAPTSRCQVATCDSTAGCGVADVDDGVLCGVDDCKALTVDVCLAGQCVNRPRHPAGRCSNTWAATSPPGRSGHAIAFDEVRQRTLLFGGFNNDTWENDGTSWLQHFPANAPSPRTSHSLTWDPVRRRIVLFGGISAAGQSLNDTWEWDGTTWTEHVAATPPPARNSHAAAFDAVRRRLVIFGGRDGTNSSFQHLNDTWEWDGSNWQQKQPASSPTARRVSAMVFDPVSHRTVLFGGFELNGTSVSFLDDTWSWDGTNWQQQHPATSPSARGAHAMTYDPIRQRIMLFGGYADFQPMNDTWEWDGTTWARLAPAVSPSGRHFHALTWDTPGRRAVMYGGSSGADEVWFWNGATWSPQPQPVHPEPRARHAFAWDSHRQRGVMFGGIKNAVPLGDTWEWNGLAWSPVQPATSPSVRFSSSMVFDAAHQAMTLYGGHNGAGTRFFTDTWAFDGGTWHQVTTNAIGERVRASTSWDSDRQRVVLVGGEAPASTTLELDDTWEFDGTTWLDKTPAGTRPQCAVDASASAYDATRHRTVLFCSSAAGAHTWLWDGATWVEAHPAHSPGPRSLSGLAADTANQRLVLFGGYDFNNRRLADTWEWNGTDWSQLMTGQAPPGGDAKGALLFDEVHERLTLYDGNGTWVYLP